jgi:hypothetical protein
MAEAILTFKDLTDQVLNYLDLAGDTATTRDVVRDTIRRVHNSRLIERKWNFMLWDAQQTITTVVGQRFYSLHQEFFRPFYFYNRTTKRTMEQRTPSTRLPGGAPDDSYDYDTGFGTDWTAMTGSAFTFQFGSVSPVQNQPSSASILTVTGETAKTVTVKGETTDGSVVSETITVGTPGSIQFTKILQVTKGDGWTQTMTLTSNGGTVTVLKLYVNEFGRQYRQVELLNTPTAAETLLYKFYRRPTYLGSDNVIPDIPSPFSEISVYDALMQIGNYNRDIDGNAKQLWSAEQFRLESGLLEYDEGVDTIGAAVQYQPYIPRD